VLDAAKAHFTTIFVEQEEEPDLIEKYDVVYYPTIVWTDGVGIELTRSAQPTDSDEVLGDQEVAVEFLTEDAASDE